MPFVDSGLNVLSNDGIFVFGKKSISCYELAFVKAPIIKDLLNNSSNTIGNALIAEKFQIRDWIENKREIPVNAYIAIWKGDETELWVCDVAEHQISKKVA